MAEHDAIRLPMSSDGAVGPDDDDVATDAPGRIGEYQLLDKIGAGGMGTVWRARQPGTQRIVALKLMRSRAFAAHVSEQRFEREVELSAQLEHANIVRLYDCGLHHGQYYYAMQYVEGLAINRYVGQHKLSTRQTVRLMATVCRAVKSAHERGIIHRDIKPSNILVDAVGTPFVLDFGLAVLQRELGLMTGEIEVVGTAPYMAPEQARGDRPVMTTRIDVFALGITLLELLEGEHVKVPEGSRTVVYRHIGEQSIATDLVDRSKAPRDLKAVLRKATATDPDQRYATAGELADDLEAYCVGAPVSARGTGPGYLLRNSLVRYKARFSIGAAVLVLVLSLLIFTIVRVSAEADRAMRALYQNNITWAATEIERGNVELAATLLDQSPPGLRSWEWDYLDRKARGWAWRIASTGHAIQASAFDPALNAVRCVTADGATHLVDLKTGTMSPEHHGVVDPGDLYAISDDAKVIIAATRDGQVRARRVDDATDQSRAALRWNVPATVRSLKLSHDGSRLIVVCEEGSAYQIDTTRGDGAPVLMDCPDVTAAAVSGDGATVALLADALHIMDVATNQRTVTCDIGGDASALLFIPGGRELVAATLDGRLRFVSLDSGTVSQPVSVSDGPVRLACDAGGTALAIAGVDGLVRVYDLNLRGITNEYRMRPGGAGRTLMPTATSVVVASQDKMYYWRRDAYDTVPLSAPGPTVGAIAISAQRVAWTSGRHTVEILGGPGGTSRRLHVGDGVVQAIALHPARDVLAVATLGHIALHDASDGRLLEVLPLAEVEQMRFDPSGRYLACVRRSQYETVVWDEQSKAVVRQVEGAAPIAWHPRGDRLAVTDQQRADEQNVRINLVDVRSRAGVAGTWRSGELPLAIALSPSSGALAATFPDQSLRIFSANGDGDTRLAMSDYSRLLTYAADGRRLLVFGSGVLIVDPHTMREIYRSSPSDFPSLHMAVDPTMMRHASVSVDDRLTVWQVARPPEP